MIFTPSPTRLFTGALLATGVALVAMMLYRPAGLLPSRRLKRELTAEDSIAEQEQAELYDAKA